MVFSSLTFIFAFLPFVVIGSWLLRFRISWQNIFLFAMSVLFYAWGEPKNVFLFLATIFVNWLLARKAFEYKWLGILAIVADIAILFVFKYSAWIFSIINQNMSVNLPITVRELPIGISFYTFQAISYIADVMSGRIKAQKNLLHLGLYIAFFPQLIAGPIVRYTDIENQIIFRTISMDKMTDGTIRFMKGFVKKVFLADSVGMIVTKAFSLQSIGELAILFAWLGAIAYSFQIYFDFSGYSDMAIGLGRMFGFSIPENFNKPYLAHSIRDFWRRWHISLSGWFRDYIYIPLGGARVGKIRTYFNLAIVWLLTGIWHGANWTFLIWGIIYGSLIMLERLVRIEDILSKSKVWRIVYRIFSLACISGLWIVFRAPNIHSALNYIRIMLSFSTITNGLSILQMYLCEMKVELLLCGLLSFVCIPDEIKNTKCYQMAECVGIFVLFIISISYLVKGNYSPFLYFNF